MCVWRHERERDRSEGDDKLPEKEGFAKVRRGALRAFAIRRRAMSSLASWCDAVRHDVSNARAQPKDHCHLVMSRKKMFTSVANETAEETIGRLGWHGDRATMLASGGQDWWLYYNHARFLRRQGVYIDLATNDAIARNNNFFNSVCLKLEGPLL